MNPRHVTTALAALALAAAAHAGRPLQTEDAGVLDRGGCELEGAHLRETTLGRRASETGLGLGCGLGWRSQLGVGIARSHAEGESATGLQLGGKTSLWQADGDSAAALTLAWALTWDRPAGGGWSHSGKALNLVGSVPTGPGTLHLNLGHARDVPSELVSTTWGLAYEHDGIAWGGLKWAPMAELFGDDHGSPWWNLALRATVVPDRIFLDLSYGRQSGGNKPRLVTAGFKFAF
jgi:hypothetical protein